MPAEFDTIMTAPDAVQWSEGMLLSPQHMQQNDIYWHGQLRSRLASLVPDYWGLLALSIDGRALGEGLLVVQSLSAVLPDGLPVAWPLADERRAKLSLQLDLPADGSRVRVWVGVPRRGGDAARQDGFMQRYDSLPGEPMADENTGSNPMPVARLRPNLSLIADESMLARFSACPLLEVYRDADGHVRLGRFHPPALRLSAYAFLG
jgi:type VI secretion system protein ImpJ